MGSNSAAGPSSPTGPAMLTLKVGGLAGQCHVVAGGGNRQLEIRAHLVQRRADRPPEAGRAVDEVPSDGGRIERRCALEGDLDVRRHVRREALEVGRDAIPEDLRVVVLVGDDLIQDRERVGRELGAHQVEVDDRGLAEDHPRVGGGSRARHPGNQPGQQGIQRGRKSLQQGHVLDEPGAHAQQVGQGYAIDQLVGHEVAQVQPDAVEGRAQQGAEGSRGQAQPRGQVAEVERPEEIAQGREGVDDRRVEEQGAEAVGELGTNAVEAAQYRAQTAEQPAAAQSAEQPSATGATAEQSAEQPAARTAAEQAAEQGVGRGGRAARGHRLLRVDHLGAEIGRRPVVQEAHEFAVERRRLSAQRLELLAVGAEQLGEGERNVVGGRRRDGGRLARRRRGGLVQCRPDTRQVRGGGRDCLRRCKNKRHRSLPSKSQPRLPTARQHHTIAQILAR